MSDRLRYRIATESRFDRVIKKLQRKDRVLLKELDRGVEKILYEPTLGKPLTHVMKNYRRIHIESSFVLLYEVRGDVIRLVDFDRHDRIYKKYS